MFFVCRENECFKHVPGKIQIFKCEWGCARVQQQVLLACSEKQLSVQLSHWIVETFYGYIANNGSKYNIFTASTTARCVSARKVNRLRRIKLSGKFFAALLCRSLYAIKQVPLCFDILKYSEEIKRQRQSSIWIIETVRDIVLSFVVSVFLFLLQSICYDSFITV